MEWFNWSLVEHIALGVSIFYNILWVVAYYAYYRSYLEDRTLDTYD